MVEGESAGAAVADTPAAAPAASPPAAATPTPAAEPSPASSGEQSKQSLLDAVLKVAPATTERDVLAPEPPPQGDQPPDTGQADTETGTDDQPADDEEAPQSVEPKTRKKINKLLKERRELRQEVETLRPSAEIGSELEEFARVNDLSGDDVARTLQIAAMVRAGDYQGYYQALATLMRRAQEYLGIVLPKDLAGRVRAGHMTEAAAKEFARQRFDTQRSQYELQASQEASSRQRVQTTQGEVQRAVSQFELRLSANDPDYKAKAPSVRRVAQAMLFERGGTIATVDEALGITKAAYDEVNRQMRSFAPAPRATHPQPNGATQTTSARAAPKSLMEAALQGLENARRAGG